mgnify:FL=1|tara:strand:+ start:459 stop:911 length:453 start_codon:yes stop_codon:yes gene_type:complete
MRITVLVIIFLILNNCGFTPIYSSKGSNYKIISLNKNSNNRLTNYLENNIRAISNENAPKGLKVNLVLKENISVILKDMKGNPSKNRLSIIVNLIIDDANDKLISTKQFTENFEYDVQDNKFNMKQYEKTISLNLTDKISQQIQTFLMNL